MRFSAHLGRKMKPLLREQIKALAAPISEAARRVADVDRAISAKWPPNDKMVANGDEINRSVAQSGWANSWLQSWTKWG